MPNGANRLFKIMQNAGTDTISEVVYLTVKSTNPLIFNLENRLDITKDFYILSDEILKSRLSIGDRLAATTFNDGQTYFVQQAVNKSVKSRVINNLESNSSLDSLSASQGSYMYGIIIEIQEQLVEIQEQLGNLETITSDIEDLKTRVEALEEK